MDLVFAIAGVAALLAGLLPRLLEGRPLSLPVAFLGLGMLVFALPLDLPVPDPLVHVELTEHLAEVCVIVALMGAGLKLDRPVGWRRWSSTWRLLAVAMPVTIAGTAVLGWWWAGLAPAAALLLGSALAPTDPVLASDVQVGEPTEDEDSEDEVRFALTSEAGLNDALAFPFVYLAITVAAHESLLKWVAVDVVYKLAVGLLLGLGTGWLLGKLFFRATKDAVRLARHAEGFVALAVTFFAYGVTELAGGYGFLAVFVCAVSIRSSERSHSYHQVLHDFAEQIERLLTVLLLLLLGGAVVNGLLSALTWRAAVVGLVLLFGLRPLVAWLSLRGSPSTKGEHLVIAFFGIRGIGSFYYLAYATAAVSFPQAEELWALVGFVVIVSVVVHGVSATPVMARLDRRHERTPDQSVA
ncbi:cation:proton antiporter [Virgisporangium aurantiacum]|uniref:Cation transporter n=1 Tax=Virgisporangium aurantiacum TaxID=175570 RepID=A0A8J4DXD7_9ACTN|nr:cation:proton antiporter [Virgisporangium aurantiacum]GIJ53814.1 cation transporter [Virgisporangium aurantiacum]